MIDPIMAGLGAISVGSTAAAIGALIWGCGWRSAAGVHQSDADFALEQRDAAEASHKRTRNALADLASDNSKLRRDLRQIEIENADLKSKIQPRGPDGRVLSLPKNLAKKATKETIAAG